MKRLIIFVLLGVASFDAASAPPPITTQPVVVNPTTKAFTPTTGTDGQVLRVSGSTLALGTIVAAGIATDAVTTAKILAANVTYTKIQNVAGLSVFGRSANSSGVGADITGTDGQVLRVSGTTLGFGTIAAAALPAFSGDVTTSAGSTVTTIANGVVTLGKMANLAANSIIGNNTGSPATPIALNTSQTRTLLSLVPGTDIFTQRTLTGTANEITVTNGNGVSGNPVFSLPTALTFTGKTMTGGTYTAVSTFQIGTNGTSPQPLFALTPNNQPAQWFSARLFDDSHYAQFAFKNAADGQRAFFGFIGSAFGNALRQNNFEIGTAAGSKIAFRPGDGDGNQTLLDDNGNIRMKNSTPGTGAQGVLVMAFSNVPSTSAANTGQLINDAGTLKWRGSAGTLTAIAPP